jgi:hypothetical protein
VQAEYFLIFKEVRGVLTGYRNGEEITFGRIPKNRTATLIAVSFVGKQAYYSEQGISNASSSSASALQPVDETFINQRLASFK